MPGELKLGLIGAGAIARGMYVPAATALAAQNVRLVAIADPVPGKAATLAAGTGATPYDDHRRLLEHPGLDAVVVATTISTHAPVAMDALRAGKHVLLQKPMATSVAEADALIETAQRRGLILQCEPPHRMHPLAERARGDIAAGLLGTLCLVVARSAHSGPPDRPWFYFQEHGGSVIFDMGVHALTWVLGIAGPARRLTAVYTRSVPERLINNQPLRPDIVDNALITMELQSGALASIITNYCTVATNSPAFELYGSEGTILINGPQAGYMRFAAGGVLERHGAQDADLGWFVPTRIRGHHAAPLLASDTDPARDPRRSSLGHFISCIHTGAQPTPSATFARHSLEIMVKAAEAASTGQTQTLTTAF